MLTEARVALGAMLLLLGSVAQAGKLEAEPFVSFKLIHDDNVFRFEDKQEAIDIDGGDPERGDTIRSYGVGLALKYSLGLQTAYFGGEVDRNNYDRFTYLDYTSNRIRGGLDWKIGELAYGRFLATEARTSESFAGRTDNLFGLTQTDNFSFDGTLPVTPDWALQARFNANILRNTLEESRNYNLNENTETFNGLYTGLPVGRAGAGIELVQGRFPDRDDSDFGLSQHYDQISYKVNAAWQPNDVSQLTGELGYTQRDNYGVAVADFSGLTGRLAYQRAWSAKTNLRAEIFRRVISVELTDANYVLESGGGLGVDWQLATTVELYGTVEYLRDNFEGSPGLDVGDQARLDKLRHLELGLTYKPMKWMTVTPSGIYEKRESNQDLNSYSDFIIGVDLEIRYDAPRSSAVAPTPRFTAVDPLIP